MIKFAQALRANLGRWFSRPVLSLRVASGGATGRTLPVFGGRLVIGRGEDSDLSFPDDDISRRHAVLVCEREGEVKIVDLESSNGTFVNGQRVRVRLLATGDQVRLGDSVELVVA